MEMMDQVQNPISGNSEGKVVSWVPGAFVSSFKYSKYLTMKFNNESGGLLPAGERKQDQKFMGFVHVERLV